MIDWIMHMNGMVKRSHIGLIAPCIKLLVVNLCQYCRYLIIKSSLFCFPYNVLKRIFCLRSFLSRLNRPCLLSVNIVTPSQSFVSNITYPQLMCIGLLLQRQIVKMSSSIRPVRPIGNRTVVATLQLMNLIFV